MKRTQLAILLPFLLALMLAPAGAAVRYVNVANPSPAPPYTNWASAATTIQDAVDLAVAGDEILVTNGVYGAGDRIVEGGGAVVSLGTRLTLRSANGPERTAIDGGGCLRCVLLWEEAALAGFTLTNGLDYSTGGGGAFGGTLNNCTLSGNSSVLHGGGASHCTLNNCILNSNSSDVEAPGGGASYCILNDCTLSGNSSGSEASGGGHTVPP